MEDLIISYYPREFRRTDDILSSSVTKSLQLLHVENNYLTVVKLFNNNN